MRILLLLSVLALFASMGVTRAQSTECYPLPELETAFQKVFPDVKQFILDKAQTAEYLGKYNLLGDFTHYYGRQMLINVLRSGTVLAVIERTDTDCQRVQITGYIHKRILTLIRREKGKPT